MSNPNTSAFPLAQRPFLAFGLSLALAGTGNAGEKVLALKDAPPAVQKTVNEHLKGGKLRSLSIEVDKGRTQYEAELTVDGHNTDMLIGVDGKVLEAEVLMTLNEVSEPVRAGLLAAAGKGTISQVEALTRDGVTSYEAVVKEAGKKDREVVVGADGKLVRKK